MCLDEDCGEEGEDDDEVDDVDEGSSSDLEEEEEDSRNAAGQGGASEAMETTEAVGPVSEHLVALRELIEEQGMDTLFPPLDGTAFYALICRINHSCDPNVRVTYVNSPQFGLQAHLIALRPIQPGEELLQSYIDQFQPFAVRQKALKDYGFQCECTKCLAERGAGAKA